MDKSFLIPLSRRSFMKLMGAAAAGTLLGSSMETGQAVASSTTAMNFTEVELPVIFNLTREKSSIS